MKKLLKGAAIGVLLGTIAAVFFNKKSGVQNRAKVQKAARQLMKRVTAEIGGLKEVTKKNYDEIVKKVMLDMQEDKTMSKEAWAEVAAHLKDRWTDISRELKEKSEKIK
jgi:gas vesicle protein